MAVIPNGGAFVPTTGFNVAPRGNGYLPAGGGSQPPSVAPQGQQPGLYSLGGNSQPVVGAQHFSNTLGSPVPVGTPSTGSQPSAAPGGYGQIGGDLNFNNLAGAAGGLMGLGGDPATAMANLGTDYQNSYLAALSLNQQNYGNIISGYQQTQAAQQQGQQGVIAGYGALGNQVQGLIAGTDAAQRQAITDQYAGAQGANTQSNTNRGLGNTTIQNSTSRGLTYDQAKANVDLSNQFAQLQAGYASNIGQAGLNYQGNAINANTAEANQQLAFMNSVNAPYPSAALYGNIAAQFGAAQQGNANRALQAAGLAQQGSLAQQGLDQASRLAAQTRGVQGPVNTGGQRAGGMSAGTPGLFSQNNGTGQPSSLGGPAGGTPIFNQGGAAAGRGPLGPNDSANKGVGPSGAGSASASVGPGMGNPANNGYSWDANGNLVYGQMPAGDTRGSGATSAGGYSWDAQGNLVFDPNYGGDAKGPGDMGWGAGGDWGSNGGGPTYNWDGVVGGGGDWGMDTFNAYSDTIDNGWGAGGDWGGGATGGGTTGWFGGGGGYSAPQTGGFAYAGGGQSDPYAGGGFTGFSF